MLGYEPSTHLGTVSGMEPAPEHFVALPRGELIIYDLARRKVDDTNSSQRLAALCEALISVIVSIR